PTGGGRSTSSPGSPVGLSVLNAMYTGPLTGAGCSGESMIAVPTRELSGQLLASACGRGQARCAPARFGPSASGRITSARFRAAASGSNFSVVVTGGKPPAFVSPGAPIEPSAVAVKGSESQPVGVIAHVFSEKTVSASQEFARLSEVPCAHEVGIRMKCPLLASPLKVSAIFVI